MAYLWPWVGGTNFNLQNMKTAISSTLIMMLTFCASFVFAQGEETRQMPSFSKLSTGGSWDVILEQGDREEVRLESKNLDLNKVITEVSGNTLKIYLEEGNYRNLNLKVYVTYRELEEIKHGGSGNLISESDIEAADLSLAFGGSGDARFQNIHADNLKVKMAGSGNVSIKGGTVGQLKVNQSGSGNFKGMDLQAEEVDVTKAGSGNTAITANRSLAVSSAGSGNIQYQGNPSVNTVKIAGSGKLVKK
jgi:hypothetical protein